MNKKLLISAFFIGLAIGVYLLLRHYKKIEPEDLAPETKPTVTAK